MYLFEILVLNSWIWYPYCGIRKYYFLLSPIRFTAAMAKIWQNLGIFRNTKVRLMRALVFPIFSYGTETWTIKVREKLQRHQCAALMRTDAFEMWRWRRMLHIPWTAKRSNDSMFSQLKIKTRLSSIIDQRFISYFAYIMRKGGENLERLVGTEGKRSRDRSPDRSKSW